MARRSPRGRPAAAAMAGALLVVLAAHPGLPPAVADELDGARRLLRDAKQLAAASRHDVLVTIAGVQAAADDVAGALATAADLDEGERRWWALDAIAVAQARAGDVAGAVRTATAGQGAGWRDVTLQHVAEARAVAGDVAGALRLIGGLPDAGRDTLARLLPLRVEALLVVATEQAFRGDVGGASGTVAQLPEPYRSLLGAETARAASGRAVEDHAETWRSVAAVRARHWDVQDCSALAGTAPSPYTRALALVGCAEGLLRRIPGVGLPGVGSGRDR